MRNSKRGRVGVPKRNKSHQPAVLSAPTPDPNQIAFSLKQAAVVTGSTLWALRSAVWARKLPARLIGKRQIVLKTDLEKWLASVPTNEISVVRHVRTETSWLPRGLRVAEAADYLGATVYFVRDAVWKNQLPAMKLGRRLIITRENLDAFIDRMKNECRV